MADRVTDLSALPDDVERWFTPGGSAGSLRGGLGGFGLTRQGNDRYLIFARGYRAGGLTSQQVVDWGRGLFDPAPVYHPHHPERLMSDAGPLDVVTGQAFRIGRNYNLQDYGGQRVNTPGGGYVATLAATDTKTGETYAGDAAPNATPKVGLVAAAIAAAGLLLWRP